MIDDGLVMIDEDDDEGSALRYGGRDGWPSLFFLGGCMVDDG